MTGIVVAPFSNSGIRDWPGRHYSALIGLLLDRLGPDMTIRVVGMRTHRLRACEIVRTFPADRVTNLCGRQSREQLIAMLRQAACVVANNSGVSHLAASLGAPTVSVFAGTHNRREWRALGGNVVLVSRAIGCSPCQLDHGRVSPYDKACLREIAPQVVAEAVMRLIGSTEREAA